MAENILDKENHSNDLVTIVDLLSDNHYYRIPDYQRGYSWNSEKEFYELWKDIIRLYHSNNISRKHYTGMITLDEIKDDVDISFENLYGTNSFYIVDGQQRFTSIIIMLQTIYEYAKENGIEDVVNDSRYKFLLKGESGLRRFGYSEKRKDGSDDFFRKRIYESNKNLPLTNQYFINIDSAQALIEKELNRYDDDKIIDIVNIILERLVFNIYFITKDFDVRVTFETMNNRGKALTSLELLKNRLMYLSTFFGKEYSNYSGILRNKIDGAWKNIYDNLNYNDSRLSDDEYLKAHWIVYTRLSKKKGNAFIEDILNNEFSTDSGTFYRLCQESEYEKAFNMLQKYIDSLDEYSLYWASVNVPDKIPFDINGDEKYWLCRLSRIPNNLFIKAALMVVLASNVNSTDKIIFYSELERFIFINKLIGQDKNDMSFLASPAKDLLNNPNDCKGKIDSLIASLKNHFLSLNKERVIKALNRFHDYINDKYNYYYDWSTGLKYFLYEYNDSLAVTNAAKIEWYKLNSTSIEHVLPQTPEREYWKVSFEKYVGTEEFRRIVNSLGNMLLLSTGSENSSLKNYSYPVKRSMTVESKKFAYCDGSRSARAVAEHLWWTPKEIYYRSIELLNFMFNHWFNEYLSIDEWKSLTFDLNLINFKYDDISDDDYQAITSKLDLIDVSNEREQLQSSLLYEKRDDIESKLLMDYFDKDIFYLVPNPNNVSYTDWKYSFVIAKDQDKKPLRLRVAIRINGISNLIEYRYRENTISIRYWNNDEPIFYKEEEIPDEIKPFLRSLYRYVMKAKQRSKPIFITE